MIKRLLLASGLALWAASAAAQWQVPVNTIPVGRGAGVTGFNSVAGSGGAGAKCLIDTTPPTFGSCPTGVAGQALTRTSDTNVILTLGGTPATSLLQAVSLTLSWSGQLSVLRGGTNCAAASGTCLDNITSFASTGYIKRTGAGAYSFSATVPYADWPTGTQDTILGYFGSTTASASAIPNCTTGYIQYNTATHAISCGTTGFVSSVSITAGTGITQSGSPVTGSGAITVNVDKATAANLEAGTSNKVVTADIIYDGEVTITFSATQTLDFNTFLNARITATANTTSLTCSNIKASQSGVITWVQGGAGSFTMVAGWCSQFRWANGVRGVLSTAVSAADALFYQCVSTTICYVSLGKAQAN